MLAVLVNCIAIIIGSLIGVVFSKKISDNLSKVVQTGAGVVTVVIGMEMALAYDNIIFLAMAIITGGIMPWGDWCYENLLPARWQSRKEMGMKRGPVILPMGF